MPEVGVEPTLAEANTALNRARLPIPPLRRVGREGRGDYHEARTRTATESGLRPADLPSKAMERGRSGRIRVSRTVAPRARNGAVHSVHHGATRFEIGSMTRRRVPA